MKLLQYSEKQIYDYYENFIFKDYGDSALFEIYDVQNECYVSNRFKNNSFVFNRKSLIDYLCEMEIAEDRDLTNIIVVEYNQEVTDFRNILFMGNDDALYKPTA